MVPVNLFRPVVAMGLGFSRKTVMLFWSAAFKTLHFCEYSQDKDTKHGYEQAKTNIHAIHNPKFITNVAGKKIRDNL
jgi:hypothetical protein